MNFILLTYVNRSGSTFLANLLDASPKILACPEGDFLVSIFLENPDGKFVFDNQIRSKLIKIFVEDPKLKFWGQIEYLLNGLEYQNNNIEAFKTILINYRNQVKPDSEFILFKAERIIYLVRKIQKADAGNNFHFISIIRDPRAIYASQKRTPIPETNKFMSMDPIRTSLFWKDHVRRSIKEALHKRIHIISYETLIHNWQEIIRQLSEIFNIDLSEIKPSNGKLYTRLPQEHRTIHSYCEKPPDKRKINEWEDILSRKEILRIEFLTSRYIDRLDYRKKYHEHNMIIVFIQTLPGVVCYYLKKILHRLLFHIRIKTA